MALGRIWRELPSEMAERIMAYVSPNEIACTVRLINRAAAAQFCEHRTVRLSQPTPHEAFAQRWGSADAMRTLSLSKRRDLLHRTAATGVVANLELAASRAGCALTRQTFCAAVAAGQMASCEWLHQHGCPCDLFVWDVATHSGNLEMVRWLWEHGGVKRTNLLLRTAAGGGSQAVVEWLLQQEALAGVTADQVAHQVFEEVARYGTIDIDIHLGLMDWLMERLERAHPSTLFGCIPLLFLLVLQGGSLATAQRIYAAFQTFIDAAANNRSTEINFAANSLTPDWQAKVEWLAARGWVSESTRFHVDEEVPDMYDRLHWLHQQGYRFHEGQVRTAVESGDVTALRWLLKLGRNMGEDDGNNEEEEEDITRFLYMAVDPERLPMESRLPLLEVLREHGHEPPPSLLINAAEHGDIAVVRWMVQTLGSTVLPPSLDEVVSRHATIEVLAFLRECGCSWGPPVTCDEPPLASAAEGASEELLEWMAADGCPMPVDGSPYLRAAHRGNLPALDCLHRLGCLWPRSETSTAAVLRCHETVVRWFRTHGYIE